MKIRILKEAYTPEVVDSYLKDVYNAYDRLKDCLYALSHAVEDDKKLESTVDSVIYELEDDFYEYMKFHLEDVENSIHPKEEEDEEDYEESLKESYAETKLIKELQIFKKVDPNKDKIQIHTTPKGNYEVYVNDKELGILDKRLFSEDDIEDLRNDGYFDDYTQLELDGKFDESINKNRFFKSINEAAKPNLNNILAKSKKDIIDAMPAILRAAGYACEQVTNDSFDIYDASSGCKAQDIIKDIKYICDLAGVKYEIDNNSLVFNDGSTLVDVYPNITFTVDCKWIE